MPGSNGNGLRPEEEIAQNVGSPAGQGNTKSALGWAGLGLGLVDTAVNVAMTERQNRLNREENERNYERNVDFWQMQNEYNHPAAQMARLREAGLNPNLVYGTPDIAGNNANAPESSKTHYERPNDLDMLGMAMNAQQFAKQDELMSLEIERAELENEDKRISNDMKAYELSQQESRRQEEIRKHNQEIIESNKRIDEMDQNIKVGVEQALLFVEEQGVSRNRASLVYKQGVAQELENRFNSATFNERVESVKLEPKLKKVYMSYYRELARYYAGSSELNESLLSPAGSVSNENYVQRQYSDTHDNIVSTRLEVC